MFSYALVSRRRSLVQLLQLWFLLYVRTFFVVRCCCCCCLSYLRAGQTHGLRVRGPRYLSDGRKIAAGASFGTLIRADLYRIDGAK